MNFRQLIITLFLLTMTVSLNAKSFKAGEIYNYIKEKKIIRIGISYHYPPLNFNSGERGVDILIAKKLGDFFEAKVKLVPLKLKNYISSVQENKVDILISGLSRNLVRAKKIWFSVPYISITPAVLASKQVIPETKYGEEFEEEPVKTVWDLKRMNKFKFAVKKGSSYENLLTENFPEMPKIYIKTNDKGIKLLKKGAVHGFIHDSLYLEYIYKNSGNIRSRFKLLKGGKQQEKICIGLPFGDTILKNQIDIFIVELLRQDLIQKWLEEFN